MAYHIRQAKPDEEDALCALLPRLAAFEVPQNRNPDHLWHSDRKLLRQWFAGLAPGVLVHVAIAQDHEILGLTMVSLREELLSHQPSAHLEAIVVAAQATGQGVGKALMANAEKEAAAAGAQSMTLHVFGNNLTARKLYATTGYDEELIRCFKVLEN